MASIQAWLEQFPITFDTRFVAQEGRQVLKLQAGEGFSHLGPHEFIIHPLKPYTPKAAWKPFSSLP